MEVICGIRVNSSTQITATTQFVGTDYKSLTNNFVEINKQTITVNKNKQID